MYNIPKEQVWPIRRLVFTSVIGKRARAYAAIIFVRCYWVEGRAVDRYCWSAFDAESAVPAYIHIDGVCESEEEAQRHSKAALEWQHEMDVKREVAWRQKVWETPYYDWSAEDRRRFLEGPKAGG